MGILADVIRFKQQEDQKSLLDIAAIGDSVESFIKIRQNQKRQERQSSIDELNRRNILSQIETREKEDVFDQLRKINEGIEFAKSTTNLGLLEELSKAGNNLFSGQTPSLIDETQPGQPSLPQPSLVDDIQSKQLLPPTQPRRTEVKGISIEPDVFGNLAEEQKLEIRRRTSAITVGKEVASQKSKAQEKTERDTTRASLVSDTAFQEVVKADAQIFEKFGLKPGSYFGLFAKIIPKQLINNKAAALGAGREAAATVGMSIIPAARAVRMVEIFAKSSAELGNTIEGNAANVAASMGNTFARRISDNIPIELKIGGTLPMQEITKDPLTGKMISEFFDFGEKVSAMNRVKNEFRDELEKEYIMQVFNNNPDLLQSKTIKEILDSLSPEEIKQMLGE